ncbi:glycosyltransferase [Pasteurellaceae bacterium Macca]|nr:glycosyltransferase [Pasteurellaceae bacterium Macca]
MIDVIIPAYNAEQTLQRAVQSVLDQPELGTLWIIDDGSQDQTYALAKAFEAQVPQKIRVEKMPQNGGVAKARNWGALQSNGEFIAFLDADDAYQPNALKVAERIFSFRPETALVRLALVPVGIAERYATHPQFDYAWQHMQMTCGGNVVFRRAFFLACGGFPQHALFRELGGEDGALGIATTQISKVATAFQDAGVLHYCREGMHAEYLLDAILFQKMRPTVTAEKMAEAEAVTAHICQQITTLKQALNSPTLGVQPLTLHWT